MKIEKRTQINCSEWNEEVEALYDWNKHAEGALEAIVEAAKKKDWDK